KRRATRDAASDAERGFPRHEAPARFDIDPRVLSAGTHSCQPSAPPCRRGPLGPGDGKNGEQMRVPVKLPPADRAVDVVTLGENSLDFVAVAGGTPATSGK